MTKNKAEDLTGQDRIVRNVLTSWGAYLVFVVAGFLMPRLIDSHVGQTSLGIWDFCWSIVSYLELSSLGVGASVSRYVAKHRADSNVESLCKVVSSVVCIQAVIALFVSMVTVLLVWQLPLFLSDSIGSENVGVVKWVIGLLGISVAVQMAFDSSRGVITGCHRWDLYNSIHAVSRVFTVIAMILVLVLGGGLIGLASVHFGIVIATVIVRGMYSRRVCPGLVVSFGYFEWVEAKKMLSYGGKVVVAALPQVVLWQTGAIVIASFLGPAALAVYARHVALVRHVDVFVNKFSSILTTTAGSLSKKEDRKQLRFLMLESARYGVAIALPMFLFLGIMGGTLIELWMGPRYPNNEVMLILAVGFVLPVSQSVVLRVLIGINEHGRIAIISLGVVLACLAVGATIIHFFVGWSLEAVALLTAVPFTIANGVLVPIYGCNRLDISLGLYLKRVFIVPVMCGVIYGGCLVLIHIFMSGGVISVLLVSGIMSLFVLSGLYWMFLFDSNVREIIKKKVRMRFG